MNLNTLEYFVTLAESKSINQATQSLFISQPSLTRSIQSFEKEIGVQLFYRSKSGILLTEAGQLILPEAKQILKYCAGWKNLSALDSIHQIDLYTQSVFSYSLFPDVLFRFKKVYPNVSVNLISVLRPEQHYSADIYHPALTLSVHNEEQANRPIDLPDCSRLILLNGEYRILMNIRSPLASKKELTFQEKEFQSLYFAIAHTKETTDEGYMFSDLFHKLYNVIPSSHVVETGSLNNVISLLCKDPNVFTVTFYPVLKHWEPVAQNKLIHRPLQGMNAKGSLCLFYGKQAYKQHPAVQTLIKLIKEATNGLLAEISE